MKRLMIFLAAIMLALGLVACEKESATEKAGKDVDEAIGDFKKKFGD